MSSLPSSGLHSCAKILSRLSPEGSEANVEALATLLGTTKESLDNELLSKTNTVSGFPLKDASDSEEDGGKQFLLCDLNVDQFGRSSYRSPWSNNYVPQCEEGSAPPPELRQMETRGNEVFGVYKDMYYGKDALSSVYVREADSAGNANATAATAFQARFLLRKLITEEHGYESIAEGYWNSVHRFEVSAIDDEGNATYKLASTVFVSMQPAADETKEKEALLAGSLSRSAEQSCKVRNGDAVASHVSNMGTLLEEAEQEMRSNLHVIHIPKTRDVTDSIRRAGGSGANLVGAGAPHGHGFALPGAGGGAGVLNQAMLGALKKKISESG